MKKVLFLGGECEALNDLKKLLPEYQIDVCGEISKLNDESLIGYDCIIAKQSKNGLVHVTGMDLFKAIYERSPNIFRLVPAVLVSKSHKHGILALCLKMHIGLVEEVGQAVPLRKKPILHSRRFNLRGGYAV